MNQVAYCLPSCWQVAKKALAAGQQRFAQGPASGLDTATDPCKKRKDRPLRRSSTESLASSTATNPASSAAPPAKPKAASTQSPTETPDPKHVKRINHEDLEVSQEEPQHEPASKPRNLEFEFEAVAGPP